MVLAAGYISLARSRIFVSKVRHAILHLSSRYALLHSKAMRRLGLGTSLLDKAAWTCPTCLRQQKASTQKSSFSTRIRRTRPLKRKQTVVLATAGGGLGAGALIATTTDDVKYGYAAAERTGRVVNTLFTCINE